MKRAAVNMLISSKFQGGGRSLHRGGGGSTSHHQADHANRFQTTKKLLQKNSNRCFPGKLDPKNLFDNGSEDKENEARGCVR